MKIETVITGSLEENCYILSINNDCIIIDPGDDAIKIKKAVGDKKVLKVLITHKHFDHIGALRDIIEEYKVKYIDYESGEGDFEVGPFKFRIISVSGHSKDSVVYYFYNDKVMMVGDFIFKGNIGRCDLEGGNFNEMLDSISKIKKYDDDIKLFPGHGGTTSLKDEKLHNMYFN